MQILVTNNKMKFAKENLNLEKGLNKEWVITNGLGGFASSTIIGANTRRYHGLLIAPLMPPARRTLILSKLDESIEINGNKTDLYTNIGRPKLQSALILLYHIIIYLSILVFMT